MTIVLETVQQPLDATLTALAALNSTAGLVVQTGADTFTKRTLTGTSSRLSVTNGDGVSGAPTLDIDAAYVGQTSITTLGTIATGTWNATAIADGKIASALTSKTYNGLTLVAAATGFTVAGGTTSKTLTVPLDASVSGTNTGDQTTVSGNAGTATALQTARNINGVSFNGTADITVTAAAGTLTGTTLNSTVVTSSLTTVGTIATGVWQGTAVADGFLAQSYAILIGRSGGQALIGGTASGNNLTLRSSSHATKGKVILGNAGTTAYDEVNERFGVGTASPAYTLDITSGDVATNGIQISASGSASIPSPGATSGKTLFNYRGFSLCVDSAVLSAGPTFGLGVAINRAGPCLGLKNATGESINVEAGNLQLGTGVVALNTTTDSTYAGVFLGHNYTGNYYTQRNASFPSWGIDLGGVDNASYSGTNDTFNIVRQAAGAAHTARVSVFQLPNAVPANANQAALVTTAATQTTPWGFASQAQADGIATLVNAMRQIMIDRKLMKGSA